jgi:hypothetical protein
LAQQGQDHFGELSEVQVFVLSLFYQLSEFLHPKLVKGLLDFFLLASPCPNKALLFNQVGFSLFETCLNLLFAVSELSHLRIEDILVVLDGLKSFEKLVVFCFEGRQNLLLNLVGRDCILYAVGNDLLGLLSELLNDLFGLVFAVAAL